MLFWYKFFFPNKKSYRISSSFKTGRLPIDRQEKIARKLSLAVMKILTINCTRLRNLEWSHTKLNQLHFQKFSNYRDVKGALSVVILFGYGCHGNVKVPTNGLKNQELYVWTQTTKSMISTRIIGFQLIISSYVSKN